MPLRSLHRQARCSENNRDLYHGFISQENNSSPTLFVSAGWEAWQRGARHGDSDGKVGTRRLMVDSGEQL